jgi:serine protease Do
VILEDVSPGSSADEAGLHPGDIVLDMDGKPVQQPQQVAIILFNKKIGDKVNFALRRPGSPDFSVDVAVTRRPRDPDSVLDPSHLSDNIIPRLGIIVVPLTGEVARLIPQTRMAHGLLIVALTAEGKATALDFEVGDVLYTINRKQIDSVQTLRDFIAHLPENAPVAMQLERDGKLQYLAFTNPD